MDSESDKVLITDKLVVAADKAVSRGRYLIREVAEKAAVELGYSANPTKPENERGLAFLNAHLQILEREMRRLCSPYDYRTLLSFSRICTGLPNLRAEESQLEETMVRGQTADYAALSFGRRDLPDAFYEEDDGGRSFGGLSEEIAEDVVKLHVLAREYRKTVSALLVFCFLKECFKENGRSRSSGISAPSVRMSFIPNRSTVPSKELVLYFGTSFELVASREAIVMARVFQHRHHFGLDNPTLPSGLDRMLGDRNTSPVALAMNYTDEYRNVDFGRGFLFEPKKRGIKSLYEHACNFRELFEQKAGMPPAHLCALLQGLAQIAFDTKLTEDETGWNSERFFALTGILLLPKHNLMGGMLLERTAEALATYFPAVEESTDLEVSLGRFVEWVSSSGSRRDLSLRGLRPAYLIHGEAHHDTWAVDFVATMPTMVELFGVTEITATTRTVDPEKHDADIRTELFDSRLAEYLAEIKKVELTFQEHRYPREAQVGLPNVHPPMSPGEDLEIDVPLRVGSVLISVQTRTSPVEQAYEEGNYEAFHRRWRAAKKKRRDTDSKYADKLLGDLAGCEFLRSEGITHVLPIVCTPYPDPVVAIRNAYWLRPLTDENLNAVIQDPALAVPRLLTSRELYEFLESATEEELKEISNREGWTL